MTTKLVESLSVLGREQQTRAADALEAAKNEYARLAASADNPAPGDAEALRECLATLGLDAQRFETDAALVKQAQRWARETSREVEAHLRASCKEAAEAARRVHASGRKPRVGERWHAESGVLARLQNKVMHLEALRRELRRTWEQSDVVRRVIDEPPRK